MDKVIRYDATGNSTLLDFVFSSENSTLLYFDYKICLLQYLCWFAIFLNLINWLISHNLVMYKIIANFL